MPSDPIHSKPLYPSDHPLGIPSLAHTSLSALPQWLVPYRHRIRPNQSVTDAAVHFFLFDQYFESVWNHPIKALRYLEHFQAVLTPDFSLKAMMPLAVQVWNTYRSRWCGVYWQSQGYTVIPTVSWSTPASYEFCFTGLPVRGPVALTTLGASGPDSRPAFLHGFAALLERVQPSVVLCYSQPLPEMERVPLQVYPDQWHGLKRARKIKREG